MRFAHDTAVLQQLSDTRGIIMPRRFIDPNLSELLSP
jgi:hypothetical protein